MKFAFVTLSFSLLAFLNVEAIERRPTACLTIHVVDDSGSNVTNVAVNISTFWRHIPGEGFGRDEGKTIFGTTDTNGLVTLSIPCLTGHINYSLRLPDNVKFFNAHTSISGFYWSNGGRVRFNASQNGKWHPWNPTVELKIKRIINPIPLYVKTAKLKYPMLGKPCGFDLLKADWVKPYGKGEISDFVFSTQTTYGEEIDGPFQKIRPFESRFSLECPNVGDGTIVVYADPQTGSVLRLPHEAPQEGYAKQLSQAKYIREKERYLETREDENYFFRIRTEKDEEGNIVSALYGKIHGAIQWGWGGGVVFSYYLNPTPNDRNLEFDGKNNLFKPDWRDTSWPTEP